MPHGGYHGTIKMGGKVIQQGSGGGGGGGGGPHGGGPHGPKPKPKQIERPKQKQKPKPKQIERPKQKPKPKVNLAKQELERRKKDKKVEDPRSGILGILAKIGHGPVQEGYIGDEAFKKTIPAGQHKLRSQFDRLRAKYGEDFVNTSQGQQLMDYLSGVAVERGGGLGARDPGYGGATIDPTDPGEVYRQKLLREMSTTGTPFGTGTDIASQLGGMNFDLARGRGIEGAQELTPEQYYNFTQQLMAADPTPGNMAYKAARPFSSGQLVQGIAGLMPGMGPIKALAKTALSPFAGAGKDFRTKAGDVTGRPFAGLGKGISDWFKFNPPAEYMGTGADPRFLAAMQGRPMAANVPGGDFVDRGGVIDAAQSVVNQASPNVYGSWIGTEGQPHTGDFVDSDGDGVDDRWQTGPGVPRGGAGSGIENAWNQSFQVGQPHPITLPQAPFSGQTDLAASQAAGYDIPIGGGQNPNFQDWYKNLGIMQNVYS